MDVTPFGYRALVVSLHDYRPLELSGGSIAMLIREVGENDTSNRKKMYAALCLVNRRGTRDELAGIPQLLSLKVMDIPMGFNQFCAAAYTSSCSESVRSDPPLNMPSPPSNPTLP